MARAEGACGCLGRDEVAEVAGALAIQGFVSQEEDLELDPVVDWEPV